MDRGCRLFWCGEYTASDLAGVKLRDLGLDAGGHSLERFFEARDAFAQQRIRHVVEADARLGDRCEFRARLGHVGIYRARDYSVIAEILDRLWRHRVHRVGPDEVFNVEHVAVRGILGAGARPQRTLDARTFCFERVPARSAELRYE